MNQLIIPSKSVDPGFAFGLSWEGIAGSSILVNFRPLVEIADKLAPNRKYCLLHYQAKPYKLRLYGAFDRQRMSYHSIPERLVTLRNKTVHCLLERNVKYPPEAALLFEDTTIDDFFKTNPTNQ